LRNRWGPAECTSHANYDVHRVDERNGWQELGDFDDATDLDRADVCGCADWSTSCDGSISSSFRIGLRRPSARGLGITPKCDLRDPPLDLGVCTTFLPENG